MCPIRVLICVLLVAPGLCAMQSPTRDRVEHTAHSGDKPKLKQEELDLARDDPWRFYNELLLEKERCRKACLDYAASMLSIARESGAIPKKKRPKLWWHRDFQDDGVALREPEKCCSVQ